MPNYFLALRLDHDSTERLQSVCERLRAWNLPASWVQPADFHLTLAFLGALTPEEAQFVPSAIDVVANSCRKPDLSFAGIGAWGGAQEPRTVFAAVDDPHHQALDLHLDLCAAIDVTPEKSFAPHVTLCRPQPLRSASSKQWRDLFIAFGQSSWGPCTCDALCLYTRAEHGTTRYVAQATWRLAN